MIGSVRNGLPVPASIFPIVSSPLFATQIAPFAYAMPSGKFPASIVCTTVFVSASIRETVPSRLFATHTSPSPVVIPLGLLPTRTVCTTTRVAGSTRDTVWSSAFVTQYAPSATTRRVGVAPTATSATSSFDSGSMTPTELPAAAAIDFASFRSLRASTERPARSAATPATAASTTPCLPRPSSRRLVGEARLVDCRNGRRLGQVERWVVDEDRPLELLQRLAWLETELLVQQPARVLVGGERLRLTLRPVQGEHELAAEPLTKRMSTDHRLELADQLAVAPEGEIAARTGPRQSERPSSRVRVAALRSPARSAPLPSATSRSKRSLSSSSGPTRRT